MHYIEHLQLQQIIVTLHSCNPSWRTLSIYLQAFRSMNLAGVLFFVQCRGTKRRWTFWHGTGQTFLAVFPHPPSGAGQPGNQRPPASRKSRRSYRGPGSGIKRALEDWPDIEFTDDREGCLFTATVHRREGGGSEKGSPKIIELIRQSPTIAIPEIAQHVWA